MPNVERTGIRDSTPSKMRRSFKSDGCYHADVDMLEERWIKGQRVFVAVCEYKYNTAASDTQKERTEEIAKRLSHGQSKKCKALIIHYHKHDFESDTYNITELWPEKKQLVLSFEDFRRYIRKL